MAYSRGTIRNLLTQGRSFLHFCNKYNIQQWPASEHVMCLYVCYLAYTFKSSKSVRNYLYGVKTLHVLAKVTPPNLNDIEVSITMRGLAKKMCNRVKQAQPLTPEILLDMLEYLDLSKRANLNFWAMLLIGFFGMLRKSNLIPDAKNTFDPLKQLTRGHVSFQQDIAILRINWAKNLQFNQRVLEIPLMLIPGSALCPVTVLRAVLKYKGNRNHPLFGIGREVAYTYSQFHRKFRKVLKKAGYRDRAFSSHSMHRGGASFTHHAGVPNTLIQNTGIGCLMCTSGILNFL